MAAQALLSFGSGLSNLIGGLMKNRQLRRQYKDQKQLASNQIDLARILSQQGNNLFSAPGGFMGPGGNEVREVGGNWSAALGPNNLFLQDATNRENLARSTADQAVRRQGIGDYENIRRTAASDFAAARDQERDFARGIGRVSPIDLEAILREAQTRNINRTYDDAERMARTLAIRQGQPVADILSEIARQRSRDLGGSPAIEALQLAEALNQARLQQLRENTDRQAARGSAFLDLDFDRTDREQQAIENMLRAMALANQRKSIGMSGIGAAADAVGGAAAGLRGAAQIRNTSNPNVFGDFLESMSNFAGTSGPAQLKKLLGRIFG